MYEMNAFGTLQSVFDELSKAERPNPDQLFTMLETMAKSPVQHEDIVRFLLFANQKERDRDKIFAAFLVTGNTPTVGKRLGKYSNLLATLYNSNSLEAKDLQTLLETIGFDVIAEGQPVPILLMMLRTDDLQEIIFKAIDSKILGDNLNGDLVRDNVALMINILDKLLETTNLPPIPGTILILFDYGKIKDYLSHKDRDKVLDIPWLNMMFRYADGGVAQTQLTNVITQLLHAPGTNIEKLWYRLSPKVRRHTHDQLGHNVFYWMENHFSEENTLRILNGFISAYQRKINTIANADDSLKQLGLATVL